MILFSYSEIMVIVVAEEALVYGRKKSHYHAGMIPPEFMDFLSLGFPDLLQILKPCLS